MFGVIVASRPVITDAQTVSPTQFAFNIPSQPSFSHIVVFFLPGSNLNPGAAAGVYIQIPPSNEFRLLGAIANDKQSAIFKIGNTSSTGGSATNLAVGDDVMIDDATAQPVGTGQEPGGPNIILGISIEAAENIQAQLANLKTSAPQTPTQAFGFGGQRSDSQQRPGDTKTLAQRIIKNAFNFLSSFASGSSGNEVVPLKAFQDWWTKFEKRLELDPGFIEREDQA